MAIAEKANRAPITPEGQDQYERDKMEGHTLF